MTDLGASISIHGLRTHSPVNSPTWLYEKYSGNYDQGYRPITIANIIYDEQRMQYIHYRGTDYYRIYIPNDGESYSYSTFYKSLGNNTSQLSDPSGVRQLLSGFTGKEEVIVEGMYSNDPRIRKYDLRGESMLGFGLAHGGEEGQFNNARGIEVREDIIYVVDSGNKRVQVFDEYGTYQSSFNTEADGTPYGIYIDQDNQIIYIIDIVNNNCQIYSLGGGFIKSFGSLSSPNGITGAGSKIYIADTGNNKIQIFDIDGEFVSEFGSAGNENGEFNSPTDIEIIKNRLFVTDRGNYRIQVFNQDGIYIKKFPLTGLFLRGIAGKRR